MTGWIKIEKDLATDVRVRRIAKACNASASQGVTLVVGALTRLWIHADSHAREDDALDMSMEEIDELVGVPGFCAAMPREWLIPNGETSVKLPNYHNHNGIEAKKRALTQKRVTHHRNRLKRSSVTSALPDQTRPDHTKTKTRPESEGDARGSASRACRIPTDFILTPERKALAQAEHLDPDRTFARFTNYWRSASGAKARKHDWDATWRNWCLSEHDRNRANGASGSTPPTRRAKTVAELEAEEEARNAQH